MANVEAKESHVSEPYYGPPTPPPDGRKSPLSPARRHGGAYSLICFLFKIITTIIIAVGIVVLVLWLVYQPQSPKVFAESASLSHFTISGASDAAGALSYNLTVGLSIRNPNKKYSFYYESVVAEAFYDGYQIGRTELPRQYQGRKSTMPLGLTFARGTPAIVGDSRLQGVYNREKGEGFFYVNVKIYAAVRLKMIVVESVKFRPEIDCYLRIPAPANATSLTAGFIRTECNVNDFS